MQSSRVTKNEMSEMTAFSGAGVPKVPGMADFTAAEVLDASGMIGFAWAESTAVVRIADFREVNLRGEENICCGAFVRRKAIEVSSPYNIALPRIGTSRLGPREESPSCSAAI